LKAVTFAFLGVVASGFAYAQSPDALERGHTFVDANCSACHAVGPTGQSPLPSAPPFRELGQLYPVENIAEALAEGIITGHAEMPQFVLEPTEIADVILYLQSIQVPAGN